MLKIINIALFVLILALGALTISLYAPFEEKTAAPTAIPLFGMDGLTHEDLEGDVYLINIFASWCGVCRKEKQSLFTLRDDYGLNVYGVALRDERDKLAALLSETGDPYTKLGYDDSGLFSGALGADGLPYNLLVTKDHTILWRWPGPITELVIENEIAPLLSTTVKKN